MRRLRRPLEEMWSSTALAIKLYVYRKQRAGKPWKAVRGMAGSFESAISHFEVGCL